ncbi:MAG: BTAD domain-containing putative transcriptional regulator [Thiobacillus sp.]|nr:BTAD domain-containing putative transcriptional regulator [Thiobacillus sp.]MDP2979176.1 BTAD domain-containing putative transcriptional regulator [Thiobacillus sp.]
MLDHVADSGQLWIASPAGAGKSTLIADYLETHKLPYLWYQLDAGDGDVASFFFHLQHAAAQVIPARVERLPLLTPEYLAGVETFSRNFFHTLFAALPRPCAVVFDDYQEVPADAAVHRLLAQALERVPPGVSVYIASREPPPEDYARLRVSERMRLVGWDEIRLTKSESVAVARLRLRGFPNDARDISELHRQAGGWMAGLILLLEHGDRQGRVPTIGDSGAQLLFDYFAAEVLRTLDPDVREFLLKTAVLPELTGEMADRLLERRGSGLVLASLADRQLFTARLGDDENVYRYHPLFRAFLLARAQRAISRQEFDVLLGRAATLLAAAGRFEDAVALYRDSGDWSGYVAVLLDHAAEMFGQGRQQQLLQWLNGVPDTISGNVPWVAYWQGMCTLPLSPYDARRAFERAYGMLRDAGDATGQYLAWAGIADSFLFAWDDFGPARLWLDEFEGLRSRHPELPPVAEVSITAGALGLYLHARPQDPEVHHWAERAGRLLPGITQAMPKNALGHVLGQYHSWLTSDQYQMRFVAAELGRVDAAGSHGPLAAICARTFEGHLHSFSGGIDIALERLESARALADEAGIRIFDSLLAAQIVYAHVYSGNLASAEEQLATVDTIDSPRRLDRGHYHYLAGWVAWLRGDHEGAWRHAQAANQTVELHVPFTAHAIGVVMAQLCRDRGDVARARDHLAQAKSLAEGMGSGMALFCSRCTEAWFALLDGDPEAALEPLRHAFAWGAASGNIRHPWWRPDMMSVLCSVALAHDIEPEYARRLIRVHRFRPMPNIAVPDLAWPWPLRLHVLGGLSVHVDHESLAFGSKAPRKPLELLRRVLAEGGYNVDGALVAADLWPDADGDYAQHNLETTLYRLRKLLRHDGVLVVKEGRVSLDPELCWLDSRALESLLAQVDDAIRRGAAAADIAVLAERVFELYRGPLLPEVDEPWIFALREQLHARFVRTVTWLAEYLHRSGRPEDAVACCERGLAVDEGAASLHRALSTARAACTIRQK